MGFLLIKKKKHFKVNSTFWVQAIGRGGLGLQTSVHTNGGERDQPIELYSANKSIQLKPRAGSSNPHTAHGKYKCGSMRWMAFSVN